jgi:hypothetical protein
MCKKTAVVIFQEAIARARTLQAPIREAKSAGTGRGQVIDKQLRETEAEIKQVLCDAEVMRFGCGGDAEGGPGKHSRAKKLHVSGVRTAAMCDRAEEFLKVFDDSKSSDAQVLDLSRVETVARTVRGFCVQTLVSRWGRSCTCAVPGMVVRVTCRWHAAQHSYKLDKS